MKDLISFTDGHYLIEELKANLAGSFPLRSSSRDRDNTNLLQEQQILINHAEFNNLSTRGINLPLIQSTEIKP
jgi:hypothetical protein